MLVQPVEPAAQKQGLIVIPEMSKEKSSDAIVIAVGPGAVETDGERVAIDVEVGDRVMVSKYGGVDITVDGVEYKLVHAGDILCVFD